MRRLTAAVMLPLFLVSLHAPLFAHCEIPCGIYDDDARFAAIAEDLTTIEKSMKTIVELSGDLKNINQLVRWVNNKEHHSDEIAHIVTYYFMAQRVKLPDKGDATAHGGADAKEDGAKTTVIKVS